MQSSEQLEKSLQEYARQVHEMKCVISDFSNKLKTKDLTILQLQRRIKELETGGVQSPSRSPRENSEPAGQMDVVSQLQEELKEHRRIAQAQERKLQLLINDQKQVIDELRVRSPTRGNDANMTNIRDSSFDMLYISKITEEQERSEQLQREVVSLKGMWF